MWSYIPDMSFMKHVPGAMRNGLVVSQRYIKHVASSVPVPTAPPTPSVSAKDMQHAAATDDELHQMIERARRG